MFEIGWSELMLIGVVALIVIGPKELPSVLRTVGRTAAKLRRMAGEFQGQFQDALREADLADMRKEIGSITETAKSSIDKTIGNFPTSDAFDPLRSIREEIRATVEGGGAKPAATTDEATASDALSDAPASSPAASSPVDIVPPPPSEPLPEPVFDLPAAAPAQPAPIVSQPAEPSAPADAPKKSEP